MSGACLYPGCGRQLAARSYSGVCRTHMHSTWCRCVRCGGEAPEPPPPPVETSPAARAAPRALRPGTRVVEMPYAATTSACDARARITMPLAPWEDAP